MKVARIVEKYVRHVLIAFVMASSLTALFNGAHFEWMSVQVFGVSLFFIGAFAVNLLIADEVLRICVHVFRYEKRPDPRALWQVGIGALLFTVQLGFVEVFMRAWMAPELGGMPLYIVFSFMNAFLATVMYEELFYEEPEKVQAYKFKKLK
ncbi:MAG: DNA polymerase I [Caryophanon sp.]|nr:DNA polymerase I [Caryophanon sp.]